MGGEFLNIFYFDDLLVFIFHVDSGVLCIFVLILDFDFCFFLRRNGFYSKKVV